MLIGAYSDAHGHREAARLAREALLARGADLLVFLGDAVGYVPDAEVVADLRGRGDPWVLGNHEAMLLEGPVPGRSADYGLDATRARLSAADLAALRALPARIEREAGGRRLLLVHGSPSDPTRGYVQPDTDLARFGALPYDVVLMGHTHRPFARREGATLFVNAGSCALPRGADPRGSCALIDTGTLEVEFLPLDLREANAALLRRDDLAPSVRAALARGAGAGA